SFSSAFAENLVETVYGLVQGFDYATESGNLAEIFLGIPFAAPPVGDRRLEKPIPPSKWSTTLQADKFGPHCVTHYPIFFPGSEDCLYLNIFRPKEPSPDAAGYPVVVWIHGGAYVFGDTELYGYKHISNNFVEKGLVFVSVTYRLGPFGYFSSNDSRVPSNLGLWDLTQSLKFLHQVLPSFGGDTSRITIMGHSAGSGSVSWLTASPESNDLFAQAIEMSGSVYSHWSSSSNIVARWSKKFATAVGCDYDAKDLKQCLKNAPLEDFLAVGKNYPVFDVGETFAMFNPRIDGDFLKASNFDEAFETAPGKPTLFGLTTQEGLLWSAQVLPVFAENRPFYLSSESQKRYSRNDLVAYIRDFVATESGFGKRRFEAANDLVQFYTKGEDENSDSLFYFERFTQLLSDMFFVVPHLREIQKKQPTASKSFLYLYDHDLPQKTTSFQIKGTTHAAEWTPLFGIYFFGGPFGFTEADKQAQKNFVEMF
uniref:Carboxylic ester hydrolase n=1 Tax=Panagrolaimus sp. JU765 TaxID=591449 RepID=A0AC34QKH8_9BILA